MLNIDYKYIYFIGSLCLFIPYIIILIKRGDFRKFALPLALIVIPFGILSEALFFRDYWYPPSVWETNILGLRVLLSDILFSATLGFLMAFLYPTIRNLRFAKKVDIKTFSQKLIVNHVVVTSMWSMLTIVFGLNSIFSGIVGTTVFSLYVLYKRRDLIEIYIGSLVVCGLCTLVFYYLFQLIVGNDYLYSVWLLNHKAYSLKLFGIGVPITEVLFGTLVGPFYGILIPYLSGSKYIKR